MAIEKKTVSACQTCQAPVMSHQACKACGYYKGIKVLKTKSDRMHKRTEALRAKQAKDQKHDHNKSEDKE